MKLELIIFQHLYYIIKPRPISTSFTLCHTFNLKFYPYDFLFHKKNILVMRIKPSFVITTRPSIINIEKVSSIIYVWVAHATRVQGNLVSLKERVEKQKLIWLNLPLQLLSSLSTIVKWQSRAFQYQKMISNFAWVLQNLIASTYNYYAGLN